MRVTDGGQGTKKAKECKARAYLECSAKDVDSVTQVFQQAVKVVMDKDKKMWADVHKKAKKEEKAEAKKIAKIEARMKKMQKATSKNEVADVDELLPDEE